MRPAEGMQVKAMRSVRSNLNPIARVRRFLRRRQLGALAITGSLIITTLVLVAILAPFLAPHDPLKQDTYKVLGPPTLTNPFGLDDLGRDILSRTVYGSRVSLQVGAVAVTIALVIGTFLGLLSGYCRGWVDSLIMRIMDGMLAFPPLILAMTLVAVLGPSMTNIMVAIGIMHTPRYARLVRGQVLSVREEQYFEAAQSIGARPLRIMLRHILPNVTAPIIVMASLGTATAILAEAGLSFLGLGVQPPTPAWGSMVSKGLRYIAMAPWTIFGPGAAIFVTVMAFNFLGDGIRDALDPRLRR